MSNDEKPVSITISFTKSGLRRGIGSGVIIAAVVVPAWLIAGQVGALTTFTAGTPIRAGEVNANFQTVRAAIDDNESRLAALESTPPGALATYVVQAEAESVGCAATESFAVCDPGDRILGGGCRVLRDQWSLVGSQPQTGTTDRWACRAVTRDGCLQATLRSFAICAVESDPSPVPDAGVPDAGTVGYSLYFNGVDATATVSNTTDMHLDGMSWTQEAWVRPTEGSTWIRHIWAKKRSNENLGWTAEWKDGNHVTATNLATANDIMAVGEWSHVAITFDHGVGEKCIWINGASVVCGAVPPHQGLNTRPLTLGNEDNGIAATYFAGYLDELRISSTVRYTAPFLPAKVLSQDADTIGLWHFDEGVGTAFASAVGDMPGTLTNAVFSSDVP